MVGRTIGHYRIVSQVGAGGMGVVYQAEDIRLGRAVALKFVSEDYRHDPQALARLRSEARAASALNHPNICTIFDVGDDEGHPFIVMELLRGQTLRERLETGPLRVHHLVDIGIDIADALQATHADGVIHRDIKPGNIFLTERGPVKLLDFGLAKLTPTYAANSTTVAAAEHTLPGLTLGTVAYMSPEQSSGEDLDGRTDLFSLGVVLYECATGRHPFPGKTPAVVLAGILSRAPTAPVMLNPDLPVRLQDIINNCLEKDRELRYQSAADLRADLKRLRRDLESGHSRPVEVSGVAARPTSGPVAAVPPASGSADTMPRGPTSRRAPLVAAVAVAAVLIGGLAYTLWPRATPAPAGDDAIAAEAPVDPRLTRAAASLQARDYRAALALTSDVLAADGTNVEATRIHDAAQQALSRYDDAVADARRQLAAGDVTGAAAALEIARDLDPSAPATLELSARLVAVARERDARPAPPPARQAGTAVRPPAPPGGAAPTRDGSSPPPPSSPPTAPAASPPDAAIATSGPPLNAPVTAPPARPPAAARPPVPPVAAPTAAAPRAAPVATPTAAADPPPVNPPVSPAPAKPSPSATPAAPGPAPPRPTAGEVDEAAIRQVIATYGRAIETKDLRLFRTVKPNLSAGEERRLQEGFRAVGTQEVTLSVASIDRRDDAATAVVMRRDTVEIAGRRQVIDTRQTLSLSRAKSGWVITEIR